MEIFNHIAYKTTGKELDKTFFRCDQCKNFCHVCRFFLEEANTTPGYENIAWCTKKRRP